MKIIFTQEIKRKAEALYVPYELHHEWNRVIQKVSVSPWSNDFYSLHWGVERMIEGTDGRIIFDCMIRLLSVEP